MGRSLHVRQQPFLSVRYVTGMCEITGMGEINLKMQITSLFYVILDLF